MKRFAVLFTSLLLACGFMFAQSDDADADVNLDTKTYEIVPENQHVTDKNAKVRIEFSPAYDEAHFYYDTLYITYDQGEAMNTFIACLEDFMKEQKYYHYRYLQKGKTRFFRDERGQRKAQYSEYIKFTR